MQNFDFFLGQLCDLAVLLGFAEEWIGFFGAGLEDGGSGLFLAGRNDDFPQSETFLNRLSLDHIIQTSTGFIT